VSVDNVKGGDDNAGYPLQPARHAPERQPGMDRNASPACSGTEARHGPESALAQARARGVVLGAAGAHNLARHRETRTRDAQAFAERLRGVFEGFELRGLSQRQMVAELNALGIKTPTGGSWRLKQVQRVRARLPSSPPSF
jgi:hypothetical protein